MDRRQITHYCGVLALAIALVCPEPAQATSRQKLKLMWQRLTGLPADSAKLDQMQAVISSGGSAVDAARIATNDDSFINSTIKHMFCPLSNRGESYLFARGAPPVPPAGTLDKPIVSGWGCLSDFTATAMGVVRDDLNAQTLLTGDFFYRADPARLPPNLVDALANDPTAPADLRKPPGAQTWVKVRNLTIPLADPETDISNLYVLRIGPMFVDMMSPRYLYQRNLHYEILEYYDVNVKNVLVQEKQRYYTDATAITNSEANPPLLPDTAGLLTTTQWAREHMIAGTNRRNWEYAAKAFLCTPIADFADPAFSTPLAAAQRAYIRQDVSKANRDYMNKCVTCHTGLDRYMPDFTDAANYILLG